MSYILMRLHWEITPSHILASPPLRSGQLACCGSMSDAVGDLMMLRRRKGVAPPNRSLVAGVAGVVTLRTPRGEPDSAVAVVDYGAGGVAECCGIYLGRWGRRVGQKKIGGVACTIFTASADLVAGSMPNPSREAPWLSSVRQNRVRPPAGLCSREASTQGPRPKSASQHCSGRIRFFSSCDSSPRQAA